MGKLMITRKCQWGGRTPDGFAQPTQIVTDSGEWTCPRTGTYRVSCIGSGGVAAVYLSTMTQGQGFCIAGGGAGGIAESQLKLSKGDVITTTANDAVTSFGTYLSAAAGQPGVVSVSTQSVITKAAGIGGTASGGNIGNYQGGSGRTNDTVIGGSTNATAKFGGAVGNEILSAMNQTSSAFYLIVVGTRKSKTLYQFGAGQGDASSNGQRNGINIPVTASPNGAIIIEFIK